MFVQLFLWDVDEYIRKIPTMSSILTSRTVHSRIEQPIRSTPEIGAQFRNSHFEQVNAGIALIPISRENVYVPGTQ